MEQFRHFPMETWKGFQACLTETFDCVSRHNIILSSSFCNSRAFATQTCISCLVSELLDIAHNNFEGLVPEFVGMIPSLREFYFAGNSFGGTYPSMPGMWRSLGTLMSLYVFSCYPMIMPHLCTHPFTLQRLFLVE